MKNQKDYFVEKLKLSSAVDNIDVTITYTRGHKYEIIGWDNQYGEEFPETMPHIHYNENEKIKYIERKTTLYDVLKVIEDKIRETF